MKKHGEPYMNLPYFEAMKITFDNLQEVADEVAEGTFEIHYSGCKEAGADGTDAEKINAEVAGTNKKEE